MSYYTSVQEALTDLKEKFVNYINDNKEDREISFSEEKIVRVNNNTVSARTIGCEIDNKKNDNTIQYLEDQIIHLADNILLFIRLYDLAVLSLYWRTEEYKDTINDGLYDANSIKISMAMPIVSDSRLISIELKKHLFQEDS
jgi:hypothetical protein